MEWYVVQCMHLAEARTAVALRLLLGVEVYLPEVQQMVRGRTTNVAFFPGYMFVHINLQIVALSRLNRIPGVIRLLVFDNQPHAVADDLVEAIRARVNAWQQSDAAVRHAPQPGEPMRVVDAPLAKLDAIFVDTNNAEDRMRILIDFFGQQRTAETGRALLHSQVNSPQRRARRSRGRKRRLRQL